MGLDRSDLYLAQIALETRRSYVTKPEEAQLKDFILNFKPKAIMPTEESKQNKMAASKAFWYHHAGKEVPK